jgi:hypothetical protein
VSNPLDDVPARTLQNAHMISSTPMNREVDTISLDELFADLALLLLLTQVLAPGLELNFYLVSG